MDRARSRIYVGSGLDRGFEISVRGRVRVRAKDTPIKSGFVEGCV